jgi:hypothetical protein
MHPENHALIMLGASLLPAFSARPSRIFKLSLAALVIVVLNLAICTQDRDGLESLPCGLAIYVSGILGVASLCLGLARHLYRRHGTIPVLRNPWIAGIVLYVIAVALVYAFLRVIS